MTVNQNQTVGEIVARDYRAASVFRAHGIDFCCRGGRTIQDVCESKNIPVDTLLGELEEAMASKGGEMADYST
ncbi:MAG: iron-sulfur cluster repair di-iron protein, partial [Bacteroidetes bacterium]